MEETKGLEARTSVSDDKINTKRSSPPPAYADVVSHVIVPDLTSAISNLKLEPPEEGIPIDQCVAHLKLLHAIRQLRVDVGYRDGLFDLSDSAAELQTINKDLGAKDLAQLREKRWAVYVARAVDRFERWWRTAVPRTKHRRAYGRLRQGDLSRDTTGTRLDFTEASLPPLDVLMVWHSYMLNPRSFFEDCLRFGMLDFWVTGLPWTAIDKCIDCVSLDYNPPSAAVQEFESVTRLQWDNLRDPQTKVLKCPKCHIDTSCPWTTTCASSEARVGDLGILFVGDGAGFADRNFSAICEHCKVTLNHEKLRVAKFKEDVELLRDEDIVMPGTCLSFHGTPHWMRSSNEVKRCPELFPNRLLRHPTVVNKVDMCKTSMEDIRDVVEKSISDKGLLREVNNSRRLSRTEKMAVRRMMSHYWDNHSPFALDLIGAVIRQGTFIEKMHGLDWLHSPAIAATMRRLVHKYHRFFDIMRKYPRRMAVPTLDVDLAWHTHQLDPSNYYTYSVAKTKKFINHNDKIDETALSDGFEWTSHTYQQMFSEVYSECTCKYYRINRS
ncbi:MAG: hypothetical protein M1833_005365 [Piccolia ochrophora]|nr:MAG: hypothetical protein M1833_005365 [Piccolia ochrophora]